LQYIQVSEEFTNNPNVFNEMKIFCTLLWTAIVAIAVERCRAEFLLVEIDDAAEGTKVLPPKVDEVDGIGKENEKLVVKSKLNQDTLVVESKVVGAKDSAKVGEIDDEKLVVKSKLNPDTLVVQSNIVGAKDSSNIGEVADEKLVVQSKLNPDTLVVQSNIVGAKDSANIREVADEKLVVKSKLNQDTLVVESDIVGAKDSANIGEVAPEKEIRLTPQQCCEKANVPEFCLGLCSPADVMARQGKRINACSKYDTIIEGCFQAAEAKKLKPVPLKPLFQVCCDKCAKCFCDCSCSCD